MNAHGTSTPLGDDLELEAVERVFGDAAKSAGDVVHQVGDRSSARRGRRGRGDLLDPRDARQRGAADPEPGRPSRDSVIDRVANTAQERRIDCALSNSFGFGGTNASVIFRAAN